MFRRVLAAVFVLASMVLVAPAASRRTPRAAALRDGRSRLAAAGRAGSAVRGEPTGHR